MAGNYLLGTLLGPTTSVSATSALGGVFARYEQDFVSYNNQHWASDGANWAASNYYDRAFIDYAWYARTGNEVFLQRADAIVSDYLKNYVQANNYGVASWWSMPKGIAAHYLVHGDQASLTAIGKMADQVVNPWNTENNWANLFDPYQNEGREQARALEMLTTAIALDAPSVGVPNIQPNGDDWGVPGGNDFRALASSLVEKILTSGFQRPDGSRPNFVEGIDASGNPIDKPFMNGLMNEALINYYEQVNPDPRILNFIKANLDYMWTHEWDAGAKAFQYIDNDASSGETARPAPDLNMLIVNGFGFVYAHTGNATYLQRGDQVFASAVENSWLDGSKQFNQQYASSYNYLAYTHADPSVRLSGGNAADVLTGGDFADSIIGFGQSDQLYGKGGVDLLNGGIGNDLLDGGHGADNMLGGAGNDVYVVENVGDIINESLSGSTGVDGVRSSISFSLASTARVLGAVENLTLLGTGSISGTGNALSNAITGNTGANALRGAAGNDALSGAAGNDTLNGAAGNDTLNGGAGNDTFLFNTALSAASNIDRITDFSAPADTVGLENAVFTALTATGTLAPAAFYAGAVAHDADDRILYDKTTGALIYDSNGNAVGGAVQFATLNSGLALTNADFLVA